MKEADIKLKIIVAEDDEASRQYLSFILKSFSCTVIFANNGLEAVEAIKNNSDYQFILMDIKMPEMDGLQATKEIRKFNKEVVIVAQTAFALQGDKERAIEAGCNDYLSKPIKKNQLIECIEKWFS